MRSAREMVAAVVLAVAAVAAVIIRFGPSGADPSRTQATLSTAPASYLGVYETGPPLNYQPVSVFTKAVGGQPNLVGYYSGWKEHFQAPFAQTVSGHGAATIVQWDPTNASMTKIADGGDDTYL